MTNISTFWDEFVKLFPSPEDDSIQGAVWHSFNIVHEIAEQFSKEYALSTTGTITGQIDVDNTASKSMAMLESYLDNSVTDEHMVARITLRILPGCFLYAKGIFRSKYEIGIVIEEGRKFLHFSFSRLVEAEGFSFEFKPFVPWAHIPNLNTMGKREYLGIDIWGEEPAPKTGP